MAWSCFSCHRGIVAGGNEGTLRFAQGYTVELGFLIYGHGKPARKIHLPPFILGISELEFFIGLGF